ncbi:hypothetical protein HID58_090302 [Brassica napus]|uniref:Uncharacterized protein n=1 Tax=Brassica napus TaxID=3708 RepID=A0ABQ7X4U0_BRANA|nr:hypothetical protein HID58_090302 [Brassica napus]
MATAEGAVSDLFGKPLFLSLYDYMEEFTNLRLVQRYLLSSLILLLRHVLRENAFSYDKGVLAEILEPVMGKGLIPADLDTWKSAVVFFAILRLRTLPLPAYHFYLLYKDYQGDQKLTITTYSSTGVAITTSGTNKGNWFVGDVATQVKNKNFTILTIFTYDEATPGLKAIVSAKVPDQKSAKVELQYLHPHAGICTSVGLTTNPVVNFSGVIGTSVLALGTDVSFDTESGNFKNS